MDFVKGQRYLSQTESELGLGHVLEFNQRMVKIQFDAVNETRIYATASAPISRVEFKGGDEIQLKTGEKVVVQAAQDINGLLAYLCVFEDGEQNAVIETEISDHIKLNKPIERLASGNLDSPLWYHLKKKAFEHSVRLKSQDLFGLLGCRTSLLKHQLYISHQVGKRFAPRVLLADEVGLGKTIEAGLIIHQQLLTGKSQRVLIIVPESLKHQWMIEMLRRFNLKFSVFDEQHCQAIEESTRLNTPFESSQLALVSLDFIKSNASRFQQLVETEWDLMVVDEAHHLKWSQESESEEYSMIAELAESIRGVLLLTATPEQLGRESHYARLKLLDPNRFHDFSEFVKEENSYQPVAEMITALVENRELNEEQKKLLENSLSAGEPIKVSESDKTSQINHLLDLHGTGRLLFRNTRSAIKGFPKRILHSYELENSYKELQPQSLSEALSPELSSSDSFSFDQRFEWLVDLIRQNKEKKILLITSHKKTVLMLAEALRIQQGIHASVFHEGLSLIERDKSAAWFADLEDGAQILLCSEIGSEGRNFQFAHHAVFFDLPLNPDLLEQRIGRLDRIGQAHDIHIHVPYFNDSISEKVFKYHHLGLGVFENVCPAAFSIYQQTREQLLEHLQSDEDKSFDDFLTMVNEKTLQANQRFDSGRDRLLEFNSCREPAATELYQTAKLVEDSQCQSFMHQVFDAFGVHCEDLRSNVELIRASESMQDHFPGLIDEGMSITFDRNTALADETLHYLSWEHPMVQEILDLLITQEKGNANVCTLAGTGLRPSTLILQSNFQYQVSADPALQASRFVKADIQSLAIDEQGRNVSGLLEKSERIKFSSVDKKTAIQIIKIKMDSIKSMHSATEAMIQNLQKDVVNESMIRTEEALNEELQRLQNLKKKNPNVREEELNFVKTQKNQLIEAMDSSQMQLVSVRLLICV